MKIVLPRNVALPVGLIPLVRRYQIPVERTEVAVSGGPLWQVGAA